MASEDVVFHAKTGKNAVIAQVDDDGNVWRLAPSGSGTFLLTKNGSTQATLSSSSTSPGDNVLLTFGADADIAMVNRTTVLNSNTTLTGVVVGTPVTPAVAANSLIVSNVTADGDMLFATQTGGNSQAFMFADASANTLTFYAAGVAKVVVGSGGATFPANADILFTGTTGTNDIVLTNGLADALSITDGSADVVVFDTSTTGNLITMTSALKSTGYRMTGAGFIGLGTGEAVTIASGVATVTKPYVILDAEGAGTTDTLDSITYTGVADGDLLLLVSTATDTITVDDANINLGAATRALAPGGSLLLRYDGTETQWTEVAFLTAADNT